METDSVWKPIVFKKASESVKKYKKSILHQENLLIEQRGMIEALLRRDGLAHQSLIEDISAYVSGGKLPSGKTHILIACMPKSGSSFLTQALSQIPDFKSIPQLPGYERREQELDVFSLISNSNVNYVAQHHIRFSEATSLLIQRFKIRTIFLTRNIFDACVSFRDHIRRESGVQPMAFIENTASQWDDETLEIFLADMVIPWYFNFFISWSKCDHKYHATYEDLSQDPIGTLEKVIHYCGIETGELDIETLLSAVDPVAARKNVGKTGRGERLHPKAREKIIGYSRYYPDIDFSSIGIDS